ncbi:MAG: hypothetical protein WBM69_18215 [Desulfobacterales bacterium]|jgi:hypothetical protein
MEKEYSDSLIPFGIGVSFFLFLFILLLLGALVGFYFEDKLSFKQLGGVPLLFAIISSEKQVLSLAFLIEKRFGPLSPLNMGGWYSLAQNKITKSIFIIICISIGIFLFYLVFVL